MNRNLSSSTIFKYPVSDAGQHFIYSCNRLASILQLTEDEIWTEHPDANHTKDSSGNVIQSGIEMNDSDQISESQSA